MYQLGNQYQTFVQSVQSHISYLNSTRGYNQLLDNRVRVNHQNDFNNLDNQLAKK